jgi:hypothetical protein
LEYTPLPPSGCHLGEKFENEKRKRGKMLKKNEKEKEKEKMGVKGYNR